MNPFSALPRLSRPRPGRLELSLSPAVRALYLGLGLALIVVLNGRTGGWTALSFMFALLIALAASAEDRWRFDADANELRRRFGLLFFAKAWAVGLDELASVELIADASGIADGDPYAALRSGIPRGYASLRLVLGGERRLTMYAAPAKRREALAAMGRAIAEHCCKPFIEA